METDAQTLVWLLNQPPNDLPNAMITRWLTYIRLFDFDVKHIPGNKNGGADTLSRRRQAPEDDPDDSDPDDYFDSRLYSITTHSDHFSANSAPSGEPALQTVHGPPDHLNHLAWIYLLEGEYDGQDLLLGQYLETLQRPDNISDQQFQQLRKKSPLFFVRDGLLFKRSWKRGLPSRRVLGRREERLEAIRSLHDEKGHRGKQTTYENISRRYQWKGMYEDVANYVKTCVECQKRARMRY